MTGVLDQLANHQNGKQHDGDDTRLEVARRQLEILLDLPDADISITAVRWFGAGQAASIDIALSNKETMTFPSVLDMIRPQRLAAELVACTGATPKLRQEQAVRAVSLARLLGEYVQVTSEDDQSLDWGTSFLQGAETLEFVLDDQRNRWAAFEQLAHRDPWTHARGSDRPYEHGCIVLRDVSGTRFIRSEWFTRYVRSQSPRETPSTIHTRMARVGWERRGKQGRIKATPPSRHGALIWAFWIIPAGWGDTND